MSTSPATNVPISIRATYQEMDRLNAMTIISLFGTVEATSRR